MIGKINRSSSFEATLRYVSRDDDLVPLFDTLSSTKLEQPQAETMAAEMDNLAMRSRGDRPCLHVALSPERGDDLSDVEWAESAALYIQGMGLESNQYAAYLHHDEDYGEGKQPRPHMHIVANLVGSDGKQVEMSYDYYKSQEVIRGIEADLGLEPRPSWWEVARDKAIEQEQDEQHRQTTTGNRELSAQLGPEREQWPGSGGGRGRSAQAPGGNLQMEQDSRREFGQENLSPENAHRLDAAERSPERGSDLGRDRSDAAPGGKREGTGRRDRAAEGQDSGAGGGGQVAAGQHRAVELASLLRSEVRKSQSDVIRQSNGIDALHLDGYSIGWNREKRRLAVMDQQSEKLIAVVQQENPAKWRGLGPPLSAEQADGIREAIAKHQARRAQRIQERQLEHSHKQERGLEL